MQQKNSYQVNNCIANSAQKVSHAHQQQAKDRPLALWC